MNQVIKNPDLSSYSSMGIGGIADSLTLVESLDHVKSFYSELKAKDASYKIIAGCSNLLIADDLSGLELVQINIKGIEVSDHSDHVLLQVGAGESLDEIVAFAAENNFKGIECLSGIPGWIGAMVVQNVGAYGVETSDLLESLRVFDTKSEEVLELSNEDCGFSYRKSRFNTYDKDRFWVLSVKLKLKKDGPIRLSYPDLLKVFPSGESNDSKALRKAVLDIRAKKGMLLGKDFYKSAGSFFKNPVLSKNDFEQLSQKLNQKMPGFSMENGDIKLSAAWLIGQTKFVKGYASGNFAISKKHNLSIVHTGNGNFKELMKFASEIQEAVFELCGLSLEIEPEILKP